MRRGLLVESAVLGFNPLYDNPSPNSQLILAAPSRRGRDLAKQTIYVQSAHVIAGIYTKVGGLPPQGQKYSSPLSDYS